MDISTSLPLPSTTTALELAKESQKWSSLLSNCFDPMGLSCGGMTTSLEQTAQKTASSYENTRGSNSSERSTSPCCLLS